ncbi:MAG: YebC/PmpR family DNA-binding transcriptional regulator [Minisyncoccia bacterium]
MSGHSKWAKIKRKKGLTDAKKGQLFSKLSKIIELAAKKGSDTKTNLSLKAAVDQAKAENMPSENIERAIKKGSGQLAGETIEEVVYEAYGPGGAALLITVVTANKNRTVAELKHVLAMNGASLSGSGSVKWLFEHKYENGEIKWLPKQTIKLNDEAESKLSALLSDLDDQEDVMEVYTNTE